MSKLSSGIRNVILWDYERATWQYDLLVALIIATVFLAPSSFFGELDRPKIFLPNAREQKELRQANAAPASASNIQEVSIDKLNNFLQRRGKVEELKNNPHAALVLYAREELKREAGSYQVRLDNNGQPTDYRVWLK